jgi:hypothetical protein
MLAPVLKNDAIKERCAYMLKLNMWMVGLALVIIGALSVPFLRPAQAIAAGQVVQSEKLRFRLAGDEPIASPDGRSLISGMKVIVLRDTMSDQCYVLFISGSAMSTTGPSVCP